MHECLYQKSSGKENSVPNPGFEHVVNAEQGSMGGGIGGGVGIDKEPSPRRAAIEKTQAELRQEFVVREERRRELEFLEKGGNPLDFKFGETTSIGFLSPSPTDPLAEQYITSEAKGSFALNASPIGDSAESNRRPGTFLGREINTADNFAGDTEVVDAERITSCCDGKGHIAQEGQTSQLDGSQIETHVKESEDSGGVRMGVKGYARRNRHKSNRYTGHSSIKDNVKVIIGDRSPNLPTGLKGLGEVKDTEVEIHADKNCNISSTSITKSTPFNKNGMPEALVHENHLGTDLGGLQRQDTYRDATYIHNEGNHIGIKADISSDNIQSHQHPKEVNVAHDTVPRNAAASMVVSEETYQTSCQANDKVGTDKFVQNAVVLEPSLNRRYAGCIIEDEKNVHVEQENSQQRSSTTAADVGKLNISGTNSSHTHEKNDFNECACEKHSMSERSPESTSLDNIKETSSSNCMDLRMGRRAISKSEDKFLGVTDVKIKTEEGLPASIVVPQLEAPRITNIQDVKGKKNSSSVLEKKVDSQVGGISSSQKVSMLPQSKVTSLSGIVSSKCPGVALPLEKEKNSNLSAAAKRAHEDIILEEAKLIKARLRKNTESANSKPFLEPPRRKSHWDFVLEEMSWMANDFMQERLWKTAAAAQVSRWVAQETGHGDFFWTKDLYQKQIKNAHAISAAVMKFWHEVETLSCRGDVAPLQQGSSPLVSQKEPNGDKAVRMEVNESETKKAWNKESGVEKPCDISPLQHYAIRLLKHTKGSDYSVQAEAPSTPERLLDVGILEPSWEDQFPEESLFYTTPYGAMEAYRNSVESYWASHENHEGMPRDENMEAWTARDAQAGRSPQEKMCGGDEDEMRVQYLPGAFEGSKANKARKKRKIIMRASMPKTHAGRFPPGESHVLSVGYKAETNNGIPLPVSTGKRALPSANLNIGSIPTKRIRSSTIAARQRAAGSLSGGTTGASGLANKTDVSSGDTSSLQEDFNTLSGGSQHPKGMDVEPTGACGNYWLFDASDVSVKTKKKKKSKHLGTGSSSTAVDTTGNFGPSGKGSEYDHKWQQDVTSPLDQREQIKRKGDSQVLATSSVLGSMPDLQVTNSQGLVGQPAMKKLKLSKPLSDMSPEAGTPATVSAPSPGASQMSNMSNPNKLMRMLSSRDRGRKNKAGKAGVSQTGTGIPWSTFEDQALVVLVHDFGPNWDLVSDIINSSLQIKCIFRKPKDCKERHKSLVERTTGDGGDSPEDSGSSQPYPSTLPGIPKGSARMLLHRLQGPMEEETLKAHFEQIVLIGQRSRSRKIQNDNQEPKQRVPVHPSHMQGISRSSFLTPLDLCDQGPLQTEFPHGFQLQTSHVNGLGMPNSLGPVSAVQPASGGIPPVQGTNNLPLGAGLVPSSAALSVVTTSRDVQRFASVRPVSVSMEEQQHRMQQYNPMVTGRSLQQPSNSMPVSLPVGLTNTNDRGGRMLPGGNAAGMMSGLNRGISLPRPGFPSIGSPGILGMTSSGISNMLPCSGVGLPAVSTVTSGAITSQGNLIPRSRDSMQMLRPGQSTDDQRMLMQEFQLQATQGNGQAAPSFSNLNTSFSNQMGSSPSQNFSSQHQQHQMPQPHSNLHHSQLQNPNHNPQAYMLRQQLQQQQQRQRYIQQQQFPPNGSPLSQSQPHPLSQTPHAMSPLPNSSHPQQHSMPHVLQHQHTSGSQQSKSQSPPTLQHQSPQQSAISSLTSSMSQNAQKRQLSLPQTPGQCSQGAGQLSLQPNQVQKLHQQRQQQQPKHQAPPQQQHKHQPHCQQQQQSKVSKVLERGGSMIMQNLSAETGQGIGPQGPVPGSQHAEKGEQMVQISPGERIFTGPSSLQSGKQVIQSGIAGQQGQGPVQAAGSLSQSSTFSQHQKGFLQQSSVKQQSQVSLSTENHQSSVSSPPTVQPQQQVPISQQAASSSIPPLASSSSQQQRQSMQSQQAVHRKLPPRQTGSDAGIQPSPQLSKGSVQQQDQATSQLSSQPGHVAFQVGSNVGSPLSTVSPSPVVPLASTMNSNITAVNTAQWKAGQSISQTSVPYKLSNHNSVSGTQISPSNSAGTLIAPLNGTAAVPTTTTSGILSPGTNITGLPQRQYVSPLGPVHGQNVGAHPAIGARIAPQMGAQWQTQQSQSHQQQQQRQGHNGMQSSMSSSLGSPYMEPPTSGPM